MLTFAKHNDRRGGRVQRRDTEIEGAEPATDEQVGRTVRMIRMATGTSLRALAREIAVSPATLSQIEAGRTRLTVTRLHRIAAALGRTPEDLVGPVATDGSGTRPSADPGAPRAPRAEAPRTKRIPVGDWRVYEPLDFDPVLAAALRVFLAKGYHGATVRDVARACRLSVSGIYHHYPSKQHMLWRLLDLSVTELLERSERARSDGDDPVERFSCLIESLVLFHTHRRDLGFIGASEMRSLEPAERHSIASRRVLQQRMVDVEVAAAVAAGRFRNAHPHDASRAVVTMCQGTVQWFSPGGGLGPTDVAARYVGFALDLMRHAPVPEHTSDLREPR